MVQPKYFIEVFHDHDSCPIQKLLLGQNTHDLILNQVLKRTFLRQNEINISECVVNWRLMSTPRTTNDSTTISNINSDGGSSQQSVGIDRNIVLRRNGNMTVERAMKRLMKTYYNEKKDTSKDLKKNIVVVFIIGEKDYFRYIRKYQEASFKCLLLFSELAKPTYAHYFVGTLNLGSWEKLILQTPPLRSRSVGQVNALNYSSTLSLEHESVTTSQTQSPDDEENDNFDDEEIKSTITKEPEIKLPIKDSKMIAHTPNRFSISSMLAQSNPLPRSPLRVSGKFTQSTNSVPQQVNSYNLNTDTQLKTWSDSVKSSLLGVKKLRPVTPIRFFAPKRTSINLNNATPDTNTTVQLGEDTNTNETLTSTSDTHNITYMDANTEIKKPTTQEFNSISEIELDGSTTTPKKILLYSTLHALLFVMLALLQHAYMPTSTTMHSLSIFPLHIPYDFGLSSPHTGHYLWGKYVYTPSYAIHSNEFDPLTHEVIWVKFHQLECGSAWSLLIDTRCTHHYQKMTSFHGRLQLM